MLVEGRPFAPAFAVCVRSDPRPRLESAAPTGEDVLAVGVSGGRVSGAAAEEARVLHGGQCSDSVWFRELPRNRTCRVDLLTVAVDARNWID